MSHKRGLLIVFCFLMLSCARLRVERNLPADEREFLSKVRYIITSQERKTFVSLPPSKRQAFIQEFWKKRDPDPDTEVNEYKEEYYRRINTANRLFSEGGHSGWLQDRGRIYILLGPPEQRETYPRGYGFYDPPMEIWHYGFHKLIFIDYDWNGNFELQPQSARILAEINTAQIQLRPEIKPEKVPADLNVVIRRTSEPGLLFEISIPYKDILFSTEGDDFKTTLQVFIEIYDAGDKKIHEEIKSFSLSLNRKELKALKGKDYLIVIPLQLDAGEYRAIISLKDLTGQIQARRNIKLSI